MRQFARFKARHPDCILLFRIGDFYETFDDDAVTIHKALGLTLTRRTEGIPMAGVPHHQLENYLRRLIQQGYRVAVCDQVQDPKDAAKAGKPVVERAVTRVLTPGTLVEDSLLDDSAVSRLAAVSPASLGDTSTIGIALVEASTGAFAVLEGDVNRLADLLAPRSVQELLYPENTAGGPPPPAVKAAAESLGLSLTPRPSWHFRPKEALEEVTRHFGVATVAGFGLKDDDLAISAAGAILRYLKETQAPAQDSVAAPAAARRAATLAHLLPPRREDPSGFCTLDAVSLRSLEIERTLRPTGSADGSLVGLFIGSCLTPMGKRLVREWLCRPLADLGAINARHVRVALLVDDRTLSDALAAALDGVQDVARIAGRLALGRATPRDLVALGASLARVNTIASTLDNAPPFADTLASLRAVATTIEPIAARILAECKDSPPPHLREGGVFRDGVDAELDEARLLQRDASSWLAAYQQRLIDEHQLPGIKVGFNRVFGYYIELTSAQARSAPATFSRKQTLRNAERYITPELKEFEDKVTTAESRAIERERVLFEALSSFASAAIPAISSFAQTVGELDVLLCFARRAVRKGWVRPRMDESPILSITQGRHPVLEELLGERFVPNDIELATVHQSTDPRSSASGTGTDLAHGTQSDVPAPAASLLHSASSSPRASLALITGPNMAGKSTFIRQTALIVLLAHAGSFIPAQSAHLGITDRIFTRVGADDALHAGQSTFMVEMTETATILNNASPRSLIILDEIGRGTSTLDGLSLAWAIAEHLASTGARTLFATHYHELTDLEERLVGRVRNLHVSVREWGDQIVFLHRILPGRTSQSYGVHVAKLAGIPASVVARANQVLSSLAVHHGPAASPPPLSPPPSSPPPPRDGQLSLFTEYVPHPAIDTLREIKLESLSPMQAFDELRRLKAQAELS